MDLLGRRSAKAIKAQIHAALTMRDKAAELRDAWMRRWLMTKRKPRVKRRKPAGESEPQGD